jgi:hypothetical protein
MALGLNKRVAVQSFSSRRVLDMASYASPGLGWLYTAWIMLSEKCPRICASWIGFMPLESCQVAKGVAQEVGTDPLVDIGQQA